MSTVRILLMVPPDLTDQQLNLAMRSDSCPDGMTAEQYEAALLWAAYAYRGVYKPELTYREAIAYEADEGLLDAEVCEQAFYLFNVGHESEQPNPLATRYRDSGNRSLSVGDLVVIDGGETIHNPAADVVIPKVKAYLCARAGWDLIGDFDLTRHRQEATAP